MAGQQGTDGAGTLLSMVGVTALGTVSGGAVSVAPGGVTTRPSSIT